MIPAHSQRGSSVSPATYYELRKFYADQLAARDQGRTQAWLDVFDDSATITTKVFGHGSPVAKPDFTTTIRELDASFHEKGIQRRHCVSGFTFLAVGDSIISRFYALFLVIDAEHGAHVQSAAMISDVLRRLGTTWRVLSREIERDDLGRLSPVPQTLSAE
jgi:hypothetical protein